MSNDTISNELSHANRSAGKMRIDRTSKEHSRMFDSRMTKQFIPGEGKPQQGDKRPNISEKNSSINSLLYVKNLNLKTKHFN